jgi:hypothetical protein
MLEMSRQLLKRFDQLRLHRTVLRPPAVIRLLGDPQLPTNLWDFLALTQFDIRFPQQQNNLLRTVSLLRRKILSARSAGQKILSDVPDQFLG